MTKVSRLIHDMVTDDYYGKDGKLVCRCDLFEKDFGNPDCPYYPANFKVWNKPDSLLGYDYCVAAVKKFRGEE